MNKLYLVVMLLCVACLSACNNQGQETQENVFSAQTDALKKARQVEGTVMQGADHTREAADGQRTQGSGDY